MNQNQPFLPVKSDVNLPKQEEEILKFWENQKIFSKSLAKNADGLPYSFYDGPPFATGMPHYGHIMAGVLKDVIPRFWTMRGYSVPRRFGWDCHGLPVEHEINKTYELDSRKKIIAMGVDKYNLACRNIVKRYSEDWKKTVRRIGRWVDMETPYFTMDVTFMESVWWVFQELWKKGLIYEGYKVVPYSVGISTPLSNFEANLNYKEVQDPAIMVAFALDGDENTFVLAWTTTPWTLPSNMGLAIGQNISYLKVREKLTGKSYILAEALIDNVFKDRNTALDLIESIASENLVGKSYKPIFPYFESHKLTGAFRIIYSDHVTTESGTGIVHMAPAFGEEDYYACQKSGVPLVNPVDDDGMFMPEVVEFAGRRVKEADKDIILYLKSAGVLFKHETITHSYPFCWRTETPLIYRAVSSWFVGVEQLKERLIKNNLSTNWVPDHLRDGRFGKWLENARDWAISRNRFWGTPLPIWRNNEGEIICVGSKEELVKLSGQPIVDLHVDHIDSVEIPSPTGKSNLRRVGGVLDCWFESGSMPYAQWGYPKTHSNDFESRFPADFIAEGLDQTRGWFYTLMVIGTALFDKAPFKNVVVNGLILAEDGKKMSKSLKNYPDPQGVLDLHGADALRLYLIDSPVVKAQELRFSEVGVKDVVRRILLRWWNSYSFFVNYANIDGFYPKNDSELSPNILDQWLLSRLNTLIKHTQDEMSHYRLYNVVPGLLQFVEDLTNTYIRFNRSHFWQDGMPEDKRLAYETLYRVLLTLSKVMAPFAPFLSEVTYKNLSRVSKNACESVHLETFPEAREDLIKVDLEHAVLVMEVLVLLGRNFREKIAVKTKIPLLEMTIIHRDENVLKNLKKFEPYFKNELNIRSIRYDFNEDQYIQISARANFSVLGKRLGAKMKLIASQIQKLTLEEILKLESGQVISLEDENICLADVEIRRAAKLSHPNIASHQYISIEIDPTVDDDQLNEGLAREVIRKIQAARKAADFVLDDRIRLELDCSEVIRKAVEIHKKMVIEETLCTQFEWSATPKGQHVESVEIDQSIIKIGLTVLPR